MVDSTEEHRNAIAAQLMQQRQNEGRQGEGGGFGESFSRLMPNLASRLQPQPGTPGAGLAEMFRPAMQQYGQALQNIPGGQTLGAIGQRLGEGFRNGPLGQFMSEYDRRFVTPGAGAQPAAAATPPAAGAQFAPPPTQQSLFAAPPTPGQANPLFAPPPPFGR